MEPVYIFIIFTALTFLAGVFIIFKNEKLQIKEDLQQSRYIPTYGELGRTEFELLQRINNYRSLLGLSPLMPEETCCKVAKEHTLYMVSTKPSHDLALKRKADFKKLGFVEYGEVTARGYNNNESLLAAYLRSPKHKATIEYPTFTHIGISIIRDQEGRMFNTIIFTEYL